MCPYLAVDDFKNGLDARKSALTTPAGSLMKLVNATITPGGEISKRRAFVKIADLTGTKGLATIGNKVVVFHDGSATLTPIDLKMENNSLEYHVLPSLSPTARMIDHELFDGKLYSTWYDKTPPTPVPTMSGATLPADIPSTDVYLNTTDSKLYYWRAERWREHADKFKGPDTPILAEADKTFLYTDANRLYRFTEGLWVEINPKKSGNGAGERPGTPSAGDFYFDNSDSKYYIFKNNAWSAYTADGSGPKFPVAIADYDTFYNTTTGQRWVWKNKAWVLFTPKGSVATLPYAPKINDVFRLTTDNKVYVWRYSGTSKVWQVWTPAPKDNNPHYYDNKAQDATVHDYKVTEGSGKGYYVRAYQSKMYCVNGNYLWFSALKYPLLWEEASPQAPSGATPVSVLPFTGVAGEQVIIAAKKKLYTWTEPSPTATGAAATSKWVEKDPSAEDLEWIDQHSQRTGSGYINVALSESGGRGLQAVEVYYDKLSVMSDETTQVWSVDPDANQNAIYQVIRNNGTRAPLSMQGFGTGDILYLSSSGIRSLKARDASNSAAVTDIGSPVDNLIRAIRKEKGELYLANATAITEPVSGRFWMCFPDRIFCLAYFPGPKISAWSEYTFPFLIDYIVDAGDYLFIRSGDDLYVYGGADGQVYDDCLPDGVIVETPYLDAGKPGHLKNWLAIDATVEGSWTAKVSFNYDIPTAEETLGILDKPTWNMGRFAMQGYSSHVSVRMYNDMLGQATIANMALHYSQADDEA